MKTVLLIRSALGLQAQTTLILGQPANRSVTANLRANAAVDAYFEYGARTTSAVATADPYAAGFFVSQAVLSGLQPDTRYYYRMQSRTAGEAGALRTASGAGGHHVQLETLYPDADSRGGGTSHSADGTTLSCP